MADKLVSPGPRNWTEPGGGMSRAGATTLDALIKIIQRVQGLSPVTTADAGGALGTQALANANKKAINAILRAFGVVPGADQAPVDEPEEAEPELPFVVYGRIFEEYDPENAPATMVSGNAFIPVYIPGLTNPDPDPASDRHWNEPLTVAVQASQDEGCTFEVEYRSLIVTLTDDSYWSVALLLDGAVADWMPFPGVEGYPQNIFASLRADVTDGSAHTLSIKLFTSSTSATIADFGRRRFMARERRSET